MTEVRQAMEDVRSGSSPRSRRLPLRFLDLGAYRAELFKPADEDRPELRPPPARSC